MNKERLLKIEEIYHDALDIPVESRSSFLTDSCGDDVGLLKEVESLLSFAEKESSLIDIPPMDVAAEIFSNEEHSDIIGKEIEQYKIISHLGTGGMGEVFLAEDSKLERHVAIKFIKPEIAKMPDQLRRFLREAKTASSLNHPNIITIYEIGETKNVQFIATEYIEGKTLRTVMSEDSLTFKQTLEIISQIATAVYAAHAHGIIHRDIKPENIILREDGLVKVLDFGLAKLGSTDKERKVKKDFHKQGKFSNSSTQSFTQPGLMMGTIAYMSPEQARVEAVDVRSDIWSIGVVLYEMLCGEKPFKGETPKEKIDSILDKEPKSLGENIPFEAKQIIDKSLQKDADKRYQTAQEFLQDINDLQKQFEGDEKTLNNFSSSKNKHTTSPNELKVTNPAPFSTVSNDESEYRNYATSQFVINQVNKHKVFTFGMFASFIIAIAIGGYFYNLTNVETDNSVAVLPFINESKDSEKDYLSDGISESIIDSLSQLSNLKVIAENSSSQFKGKNVPLVEIADKLGVKFILRGRIVQNGDDFQVIAELIKVSNMTKIWGERFEHKLADVLNVESEISQEIAKQMKIHLTETEKKQLVKNNKVNPEAYKLLLKGHYYKSIGAIENSKKAIEFYNQALEIDPNYAQAYAALANTYSYMGANSFVDPKEAMPKAKEAANKALEINENLAEVHTTLAGIHQTEWKWAEAEREYKRALELNPNLASVYFRYSFFLSTQGKHKEAITFVEKARTLDPLKRNIYADIGYIYYFARQYDVAKEQFETGLELNPNYTGTIYGLGFTHFQMGNYSEAIAKYRETKKLLGGNHTGIKCYVGFALAKTGKLSEAKEILKQLENGKEYVSPVELAILYIGIGEKEKAFASLEEAYEAKDSQMQYLGVEQHFDSIRSDSRFIDLMKQVGLSPENYK